MIKVYVKESGLEDSNNTAIEVSASTVAAAKRGNVTDALRHAVGAALDEEVVLEDKR